MKRKQSGSEDGEEQRCPGKLGKRPMPAEPAAWHGRFCHASPNARHQGRMAVEGGVTPSGRGVELLVARGCGRDRLHPVHPRLLDRVLLVLSL
jgi:hypothetical protein